MFSKKNLNHIQVIPQLIIMLLGIIWIYPLFKMFQSSFIGLGFGNYTKLLSDPTFYRYFVNSGIVAVLDVSLTIITVTLAAYAFSKMNFPGKSVLYIMSLIALMMPGAGFIVPLFLTIKNIGLINNPLGLVGPHVAFGIPFALLILRSFMDDIPGEVLEAATIDGCSKFQIYTNIILPLTTPAIATISIFTFLGSWNDYLLPLITLNKQSAMTITLLPQRYTAFGGLSNYGVIYACLVLISIPIFIVYLFGQKYLQKGMMSGIVK